MAEQSSDNERWEYFPCVVRDDQAFILVSIGIAERIADTPGMLAKLRLAYKTPSPNGLPTKAEFEPANSIENRITDFSCEAGDAFVGRVTVAGTRTFYIYTNRDEAAWHAFVSAIVAETGYDIQLSHRQDPDHRCYFDDLYPTDDDWQLIKDLRIIEALDEHGDDGSATRRIDHWVYFDDRESACGFLEWAEGTDFMREEESPHVTDDERYCVRLYHQGTVKLDDISRHTLALRRKAAEYDGEYDGWETEVLRSNNAK